MTTTGEPALTEGGLHRMLAILCVTEIVSWGVLYYAFPVLAPTNGRRPTGRSQRPIAGRDRA